MKKLFLTSLLVGGLSAVAGVAAVLVLTVLEPGQVESTPTTSVSAKGQGTPPETENALEKSPTRIDPPEGTVLMTVCVAATPAMTGFSLPGYKVMVEATKVCEKRQKQIVFPLFVDILILAVDTPANGGNDLFVSLAVPEDKVELLSYVVEYGADIRLRLPQCGEGLTRETDTQVFLAQALSLEQVREFLADE